MTKKINVVQNLNVDGLTIQITSSEDNSSPVIGSNVVFSNKEVTIGDFFINGGGMGKFVFREVLNHTKNGRSMMVCTGFEYNGQWYGDRPDSGTVIDVFQGQKSLEVDDNGNVIEGIYNDRIPADYRPNSPEDEPMVLTFDLDGTAHIRGNKGSGMLQYIGIEDLIPISGKVYDKDGAEGEFAAKENRDDDVVGTLNYLALSGYQDKLIIPTKYSPLTVFEYDSELQGWKPTGDTVAPPRDSNTSYDYRA